MMIYKLYKRCSVVFFLILVSYILLGCVESEVNIENVSATGDINVSTKGKNIFVFVLDGLCGRYIPYIFEAKPELKESFLGFTNYPNTLSYGYPTQCGSPGVYGGYEYVPFTSKINNKTNIETHNEALKVLPSILSNNNFNVTLCDPPFENYLFPDKNAIFSDLKNVSSYKLIDNLPGDVLTKNDINSSNAILRNFEFYILMRISPTILKRFLYSSGNYLNVGYNYNSGSNIFYSSDFLKNFNVLYQLTDMTNIKHDDTNNALILFNNTTHEPNYLPYPDYYPTPYAKEIADERHQVVCNEQAFEGDRKRLDCYIAAFMQISKFIEFLKENNLYDNSKIVITADHGIGAINNWDNFYAFEKNFNGRKYEINPQLFNAALLVKDYNSKEWNENSEFMTNADVPYICVKDLSNKTNPFTGEILINRLKQEKEMDILYVVKTFQPKFAYDKKSLDCQDHIWLRFMGGGIYDSNNWIITDARN